MGFFEIPTVRRNPTGILALVFNILIAGVGTIIAGVMDTHRNSIYVGIIQLVLTIVTFGIAWIWSVIWGILIFVRSQ